MKKLLVTIVILFCFQKVIPQPTVGLIQRLESVKEGYILFAPNYSKNTYLIDRCGRQVHLWKSKSKPGQSVYLLPDGKLLRTVTDSVTTFAGDGGKIEKLDWNSRQVWSYRISDKKQRRHHDICPLPNGNILALVWEKKTQEEALEAGRDPRLLEDGVWSEKIVEIKPVGYDGGAVVWEWHVWDHLIQDWDPEAKNYGSVSENPQLIDINYANSSIPDWLHFNSIAYNAKLDQIMLSNRNFSEIFIIDHSTTKAEAASHKGGKMGKGGDLLYRWGNPRTYKRGQIEDQKFFSQHSAHWIDEKYEHGGKVMVFNNGLGRPVEEYSSVDIIAPQVDEKGNYQLDQNGTFLPAEPDWEYHDTIPTNFFSRNISGAQRLSNGHTIICEGANGKFFEIDRKKNVVWLYVNPVISSGPVEQGEIPKQNQVFRCIFYDKTYSGLKGRSLLPGKAIEFNPAPNPCEVPSK